ncbi:hypothetical protein, partial [Anaplasma marginale]|uniref:hypothetical protein n=1 Tax=Anaplasma marginale TaxID=770 RepID=UPI0019D6E3B5
MVKSGRYDGDCFVQQNKREIAISLKYTAETVVSTSSSSTGAKYLGRFIEKMSVFVLFMGRGANYFLCVMVPTTF